MSFECWIEARTISKSRTFASHIVRQCGMHFNDSIQVFDAFMTLSLNDACQVVPEGFASLFVRMNLYENSFDEFVAVVTFLGVLDTSRIPDGLPGELTTSEQF